MNKLINWFFRTSILFISICFLSLPVFGINIDSCSFLNITGVYNLTADVTDTTSDACMIITASGVTLDCNGYWITGNGIKGIYSNKLGTTVKNCVLSGWDKGINYEGSSNGLIKNTKIYSGKTGIYFSLSSNNTISDSMIEGNDYGIEIGYSSENKIYNNLLNNTNNVRFYGTDSNNFWNITLQIGDRIYSEGNHIGGNYWTNSGGTGYSDTCGDSNTDGFCDEVYELNQNNTDYLPLSNEYVPDVTPPTIRINSPVGNHIFDSFVIEVNICVSDSTLDYTNISIEQNGEIEDSIITRNSGTFTINLTTSKGGYHNIIATAYDLGNNSNSTTVTNIMTPLGVSECSSLDIEGENYLLEKDVTNLETSICMNIQADGITLDCQNYTIYCSGGSSTSGIYLNNKKNVVIKNCRIKDWNYGILLESSSENTIFNSIIFNNNEGIFIGSSSENRIYNNLLNNTNNVQFYGTYSNNFWNTERQKGDRIYSEGNHIGGNYWTNYEGTGYSDTCEDLDTDGVCDETYDLGKISFFSGNFIYKLFTGFFYFFDPPAVKNMDYFPLSDEYVPDLIPPNTTIRGIKDDGTNYTFGEFTNSSYVSIIFTCSDLRSGCKETFYCTENNTCKPNITYSEPVLLSREGPNCIRFRSIDEEGNNETIKTELVNILSKSQKIIINYPLTNTYLNNYTLTVGITLLEDQNLDYVNISVCNSTGLVDSITSKENKTFQVNLYVFKDGVYDITASFYDIYGGKDETVSGNIVVDTVFPFIELFDLKNSYREGEETFAVCSAFDEIKGNFEGVVTGLDTFTTGNKTATCTATDDAGNSVTEDGFYIVIKFVCKENEKRCLGNNLQECIDNSWKLLETCDPVCDPHTLSCTSIPVVCTVGDKRCYEDELQECVDNRWEIIKTCSFGCNETKCNSNTNPITLPPTIIIYVVILVFVVGSILVIVYIMMFEKPSKNLNKEVLGLESKIKKLKMQGKNVSGLEKELNTAKQDVRMGLMEMAKTRIKSAEKKLKKIK